MHHPSFWLAAACALASSSALAQTASQRFERSLYVQVGTGDSSSRALVLGMTHPWSATAWRLAGGTVRGHWDGWVGAWRNQDGRGDSFYAAVLGAGPSLRWRGQQGASPWFAELGTSVMVSSKHLYNSGRRMGTRWNFASHLGVGMHLGHRQAHEISLRLQHASNAGIKKPNPGLNMVQLRYARAF